MRSLALLGCLCVFVRMSAAQEADSGFELRTTLSAEAFGSDDLTQPPRDGDPVSGGFRAMLYPIWKWSSPNSLASVLLRRIRYTRIRDQDRHLASPSQLLAFLEEGVGGGARRDAL